MEITNISYAFDQNRLDFINRLLEIRCENAITLEESMISVMCVGFNPTDIMYRMVWETVYLRRIPEIRSVLHGYECALHMSISEAVSYINEITPPILRGRLSQMKTVDDIVTLLKHFLMDKSDTQHEYHISWFQKTMRIEPFQSEWSYDKFLKGFDQIWKIAKTDYFCKVLASSVSIADICNPSYIQDYDLQVLFAFDIVNKPGIFQIITRFIDIGHVNLVNVKRDQSHVYLVLYAHNPPDELLSLIRFIYGKFLK